ncbi:hypothetical protein HYH02_004631 [Chlamydomonas schloesseri]|uniref:Uncharacterized protein n=1 Tax=Chlamydomonas schloesseri TaxID=2026947 RepID=A0A835WN01_9CHLO|nr:hypothetical protein HYH02_004631 [Chlamydomonas schloesseri]|eukprot:KAG2450794.1 hypothetical protein HYH02_004631 [Chlamydomonas schloesseri]
MSRLQWRTGPSGGAAPSGFAVRASGTSGPAAADPDPPTGTEEEAAPEAPAGAQQRQQWAEGFCRAAAATFPEALAAAAEPPRPPPLSDLPEEEVIAGDAIPPLLDWVPSAAMRPVAVQSILERHSGPELRQLVAAAARLALAEHEAAEAAAAAAGAAVGPDPISRLCVTSAHLALAALATGASTAGAAPDGSAAADGCAAAVLGALHHSVGLPLPRCAELLAARAAEERQRDVERRQQDEEASGSSSSSSIFSSPALHFLFQSYRWAAFTGCDMVQPCHLLWALAADPRVGYSSLRTDPLDSRVLPAVEWAPPLVGLLEAAAEALLSPAAVYDQLCDHVWRHVKAARRARNAARLPRTRAVQPAASSPTPAAKAFAAEDFDDTAAAAVVHQHLAAQLLDDTQLLPESIADLGALLSACRLAGVVPGRQLLLRAWCQLDAALSFYFAAPQVRCRAAHEIDSHSALHLTSEGGPVLPLEQGQGSLSSRQVQQALLAVADLRSQDRSWAEPFLEGAVSLQARAAAAAAKAAAQGAGSTTSKAKARKGSGGRRGQQLQQQQQQQQNEKQADQGQHEAAALQEVAAQGVLLACLLAEAGAHDCVDDDCFRGTADDGSPAQTVAAAQRLLREALPLPRRTRLLLTICAGELGQSARQRGKRKAQLQKKLLRAPLVAALAASMEPDSASIHAGPNTQRAVADACRLAGQAVPERWVHALLAYSSATPGGLSGRKQLPAALAAVLEAGASGARERPAARGAVGGARRRSSMSWGSSGSSSSSITGSSSGAYPDHALLDRLAALVVSHAVDSSASLSWVFDSLDTLHVWADAGSSTAAEGSSAEPWSVSPAALYVLATSIQEAAASGLLCAREALESLVRLRAWAAANTPDAAGASDSGSASIGASNTGWQQLGPALLGSLAEAVVARAVSGRLPLLQALKQLRELDEWAAAAAAAAAATDASGTTPRDVSGSGSGSGSDRTDSSGAAPRWQLDPAMLGRLAAQLQAEAVERRLDCATALEALQRLMALAAACVQPQAGGAAIRAPALHVLGVLAASPKGHHQAALLLQLMQGLQALQPPQPAAGTPQQRPGGTRSRQLLPSQRERELRMLGLQLQASPPESQQGQ